MEEKTKPLKIKSSFDIFDNDQRNTFDKVLEFLKSHYNYNINFEGNYYTSGYIYIKTKKGLQITKIRVSDHGRNGESLKDIVIDNINKFDFKGFCDNINKFQYLTFQK